MFKTPNPYLLVLLLCPVIFSCVNTRKAIYFDITKDSIANIENPNTESLIQKNDLLNISVSSLSPEASELYNAANAKDGAGNSGYLVNKEGNILFPVIGSVKAEGLTKEQLQTAIVQQLIDKKLLLDPIVTVRRLNYKITVIGEVNRPSVINVPSEKISILEAIGFAGDLTLYSEKSSVLVIREENNQRSFKLLNLNSNEIFTSPYFYLKPNDVVYVKPNKQRVSSVQPSKTWLPTVISLASFAAIIATRVFD
jgi:polysaccharide export outer membrane protein